MVDGVVVKFTLIWHEEHTTCHTSKLLLPQPFAMEFVDVLLQIAWSGIGYATHTFFVLSFFKGVRD